MLPSIRHLRPAGNKFKTIEGKCSRQFSSCARHAEEQNSARILIDTLNRASNSSANSPFSRRPGPSSQSPSRRRGPPTTTTDRDRPQRGPPNNTDTQLSSYDLARRISRPSTSSTPTTPRDPLDLNQRDLEQQMPRRWRIGDVYAPHDLSPVEQAKWKPKRGAPTTDVFDLVALDPMKEYKNFRLLNEYMTPMGRIKHRNETGLRPVNQRRIARAVRRSVGMGILPSVHFHPEILKQAVLRKQGLGGRRF